MKVSRFAVLLYAVLAETASLPINPQCNKPAVQIAEGIFRAFAPSASKICSSVLYRSTQPTVTNTCTTTVTAQATVTSGVRTMTVTSGVALSSTTVTQDFTVEKLATVTATVLSTSTITSITVPTITQTAESTTTISVTSVPTTTVFINSFDAEPTAANNAKRGLNLGQVYPGCPKSLSPIALEVAAEACNCFLPPLSTKTIKALVTSTATARVTVQSITTQIVPSSTSTVSLTAINTVTTERTVTETTTSVVDVTTTIAIATTITQTDLQTATTTVSGPTQTITITSQWAKRYENVGPPAYTYNSYYDYVSVPLSIKLDRQAANTFCADTCASASNCMFYDFIQSDPAFRNQGDDTAYCIVDSSAYAVGNIQSVPFLRYSLAYSKVSSVVSGP